MLRIPGLEPIDLDAGLLAELFAAGLRVPALERVEGAAEGEFSVDEQAIWYIGATPVDADLALGAVARGIEHVMHHFVETLERHADSAGRTSSPKQSLKAEERPASRSVPIELAERDLESLVEEAAGGARITLTREEQAVAVIVPWAEYRQLREALARLELAEWAAWTDGGIFVHETFRRLATGQSGARQDHEHPV